MLKKKGKFQPAGTGMTPSRTELGKFIRTRRLELDLRQIQLAKQVGISQNPVSKIEIGIRKYLNDRQLKGLTKVLQCDEEELRKRMPVKHTAQPKTELGKFIRSRREELGLTLSDFAKKMRITPQQAERLEISKSPTIRHGLVKLLASALDLDPATFARFVERTQKQTKSELGQLVRMRRKELDMNAIQLAEKLDVSQQFVSQIELGQCPLSENDNMIQRLAKVLKLKVSELEAVRPKRRLKQIKSTNPLGGFLAAKRLELGLTQREVSERTEITGSSISLIETGRLLPNSNLLDKIAKALDDCEVPIDLISLLKQRRAG